MAAGTGWEADLKYDYIINEKKQFHEVRNKFIMSETSEWHQTQVHGVRIKFMSSEIY